jgi:hypothetical protein
MSVKVELLAHPLGFAPREGDAPSAEKSAAPTAKRSRQRGPSQHPPEVKSSMDLREMGGPTEMTLFIEKALSHLSRGRSLRNRIRSSRGINESVKNRLR